MESGVLITSQGDAAVRVRFTDDDAEQRWRNVRRLVANLDEVRLPAITGVAATYDSALVEFDSLSIRLEELEALLRYVSTRSSASPESTREPRYFRVPVRYGGEHGPDLAFVAQRLGKTEEELVALHSGTWYLIRCYGAPAASPMMDGLSGDISVPRRADPRVRVPSGSVALAGIQSLIYSVSAPAGWQLIGHTPTELVSAHSDELCAYRPGDYLGYFPVSDGEWSGYEGLTMEDCRVERD
ncbi:allophanate hydrolase [Prauserella marina]|uniref:Sensor histidine kinase inhibitor, KipI family n=1 Tax=Prauserella marina TaxID=530584 RepID=A0A222VPA9_9PSEU|nr:carboxyltransferase domain-containing protein [Prauserella marina]ASR35740.1 allophanate hydrolase [Prauserella marina]PWV84373.1 KipI family sensor histidine kinase inhibitor [Prauserella marina]SDC24194.1 sensor histidine kinase inhibitor, KipI family [Prauserella marina]